MKSLSTLVVSSLLIWSAVLGQVRNDSLAQRHPALLDAPFLFRMSDPEPVATWPHTGKSTTGGMHSISLAPGEAFDTVLARSLLRALDSVRTVFGTVGIAAGMFIPGQGTWVGASGISSLSPPESLRADMLFGIASNTKTFIATLILKLVDAGILSLDDSVGRWLPPYPNISGSIRIRQLLNMTSGLFDVLNDSFRACDSISANPARYWMPQEVLTTFGGPPWSPPGGPWRYCNTNFILLGMIIRQATSSTVSTQLRQRILNPLNLNQTFLEIEDTLVGTIAHPWLCSSSYICCGSGGLVDIYSIPRTALYSMGWTAAAIFSRPDNLAHWSKELFGGNVLTPGSMNEMQTLIPLHNLWNGYVDRYSGYGLGVARISEIGRLIWGHDGSYPGYLSAIYYVPRTQTSIVVLINERANAQWPPAPLYSALRSLLRVYLKTLPSQPVQPGRVYATSGAADSGRVFSVDTSSAQLTPIGPYIYDEVVSLSIQPETHQLIGLARNFTTWDLVRIDPTTGEAFPVSVLSLPISTNLKGMSFKPDGSLYIGSITGQLYNVELHSGIATNVASTGIPICGLAFHPQTGQLWTSVRPPISGRDRIYKISLPSGDTTRVGVTGFGQTTQDIMFDGSGNLFGLIGSGSQINSLIRIDTATAAGTLNGSTGHQGLLAMAMRTDSGIVSVKELAGGLPVSFRLDQNYPNPFNPSTVISFQLPVFSSVTLEVYNVLGQEITTLVNEEMKPGTYSVEWNASGFASGVYLYRLRAGSFTETRKLLLLR